MERLGIMSIPDLVQLCVDNYRPYGSAPGAATINICLDLKMDTWKEMVKDTGAILVPLIGYEGQAFTLARPEIVIQVTGRTYGEHPAHPLSSGVPHLADDIDLEEAALFWNKTADIDRPRLVLPIKGTNRTYSGVISNLTIEQKGGEPWRRFTLEFTVTWNGSKPAWRGWA